VIAVKAAMGAARPAPKEIAMIHDHAPFLFPDTEADDEPHTLSPTAHLLDELALHGCRPGRDAPGPRPLPEADAVRGTLGAIVDEFAAMLTDTRLEDDLDDLLWSFVNLFHRKVARVAQQLDANEQAQRRSQLEQNGSEVRSVELERLSARLIAASCLRSYSSHSQSLFALLNGVRERIVETDGVCVRMRVGRDGDYEYECGKGDGVARSHTMG
jgi:hypothetical protein